MKKIIIILTVLASFGLISSQAMACYWDGYWGGPMIGAGGEYGYSAGSNQEFLNDTADLRGALAAKQGEYNALMAQSNPDPKRAAQISREIITLHDKLRTKAQAHNLPRPGTYNSTRGNYRSGCGCGGGCW